MVSCLHCHRQGRNSIRKSIAEESCSPHGSQEAERKGLETNQAHPTDLLPGSRPCLLIALSAMKSAVDYPLMKLVPSWSNHLSIAPPAGSQTFKAWAFGAILYLNYNKYYLFLKLFQYSKQKLCTHSPLTQFLLTSILPSVSIICLLWA
jgi:hypothetical protein